MLKRFGGRFWSRGSRRGVRGSLMPMFAVMAAPVILSAGVGVDLTRVVLARADLQGAVDGAALAAATAAGSQKDTGTADTTAQTVAKAYFNSAGLGPSVTTPTLTITSATTTATPPAYTVTVSASATVATTFLKIASMIPGAANYDTIPLGAHAKASNPVVPGSLSSAAKSQPVITLGTVKSDADDWNSAYLYAIPSDGNGGFNYGKYPTIDQMYEIGSNCNTNSTNFSSASPCKRGFQSTLPTKNTLPAVSSDQPLGILFVNMTDGLTGNGKNQYQSPLEQYNLFTTAAMSSTSGPAGVTDNSRTVANYLIPNSNIPHSATTYGTSNTTSGNCSVIIQQIDPGNPPTKAPASSSCFKNNDQDNLISGAQFANMTCGQMAGRTFMFWWNDMGGGTDDHDYNDLYFSLTCSPGATSTSGGTGSSGTTATANAQKSVTLIQ